MSMFARLISWFAEDVIVKTLSNSRRFQQFALKVDNTIQTNKKVIDEHVIKNGAETVVQNMSKVKDSTKGFKDFGRSFAEELKREIAAAREEAARNANKK